MSNKVIDYVMNSPQNTNPNVLKGLLESFAGGGGTDFSTAEVTINSANGDEGTVLLMPNIQDSDRRTGIQVFEVTAIPNTPKTYNVPLFKGHCFIKVNSGEVNGLTGNVTSLGNWLDVTGNCSLIAYYVMH